MFSNFSKEQKLILGFSILVISCTLCRNCFICKWVPKLDGFRMYKEGFEGTAPLLHPSNSNPHSNVHSNPLLVPSQSIPRNPQIDSRHTELQSKINSYIASIQNVYKAAVIIMEKKQKTEYNLIEAEKKLYKIENDNKDASRKLREKIKNYTKDLNKLDKEKKDLDVTYKQKNTDLMMAQNELNKYITKK
jgi:hypothetical protein